MKNEKENMNDIPLDYSDKILLYHIAVHPNDAGDEIMESMGLSTKRYSEMIDKLMDKELVTMKEEGAPNWRVTELGRLILEKILNLKKYDLLYAKKKDNVSSATVDKLQKDKLMFKRALKACKGRIDYPEEEQDEP